MQLGTAERKNFAIENLELTTSPTKPLSLREKEEKKTLAKSTEREKRSGVRAVE